MRKILAAALGALFLSTLPGLAANDQFLCSAFVQGESEDDSHRGCIDVLAWSGGMSNVDGKMPDLQALGITKFKDAATIDLMMFGVLGVRIPEMQLIVRKAGASQLEYFTILLSDVLVQAISQGGSGGEDRLTENISLLPRTAEFTYVQQDGTGSPFPGESFCYNYDRKREC